MACGFDKGLIAAYYDGEATGEERAEVERHLGSCPECARDLAAMKDLSSSLKSLGRASAPASIVEGVAREIAAIRAVRRPWLRWGLATAAGVLIGVGIIAVVQDRQAGPQEKPLALASERNLESPRRSENDALERKSGWADKDEVLKKDPAGAQPPAAEADGRVAGRDEEATAPAKPVAEPEKKVDEAAAKLAPKEAKPSVPVIQVTSEDVASARAEVEAFLKEREMSVKPGAPLLGRSAFVKDHYLQIELSDEEVKLLEKRLAALKKTGIARGTLEAERKRVAESEASIMKDRKQEADAPAPAEEPAEARGAAEAKAKEETSREFTRRTAGGFVAGRKKIILVFLEPPPAKK
ncbi:MAG TPA: zf-HC2 domain-containing protein [Planctomycetota bacterium]